MNQETDDRDDAASQKQDAARYLVSHPLPPAELAWLEQQRRRVAETWAKYLSQQPE